MKSLNNSIYSSIFLRKSTRKYTNTAIPKNELEKLQAFMKEVIPLLPSEPAAFQIQPHKGNVMKIAAYANSGAAAFINLAFMLQQMDLFIQANGMGALWNATARATTNEYQGLTYKICFMFGIAEAPIRTNTSEFSRKQSEEISDRPELSLVEAVRMAPSARNRQPWYLICKDRRIDFYCKKGGILDNILLKDLCWFDMGIAVCHGVLALQQDGFFPTAVIRTNVSDKDGYIYCISLNY